MAHADVNGQRIYYEVHGEGEPLLCVHGLSLDTLSWLMQVPAWSQHYQTVIFDNRDVGQSSYAEADYEVTDMAADALGLADHLGLESFHLLGVSMGGAIAQQIALSAPERVRTLTLCVTFGGSGAWGRLYGQMLGKAVAGFTPEDAVDNFMLLCFTEQFFENAAQVEFMRTASLSNPNPQRPDGFARQAAASGRHDVRDRLGSLDIPTHVIGGSHDILVPVWKSEELAELIPGAKLTVFDGSGHGVQWERAEEFNRAVLDFLAS